MAGAYWMDMVRADKPRRLGSRTRVVCLCTLRGNGSLPTAHLTVSIGDCGEETGRRYASRFLLCKFGEL